MSVSESPISRIRSRVSELVQGTPLAGWSIAVRLAPTPSGAAAEMECDHELKKALLAIHPDWPTLCLCSLDQLLAHELGHALIGDCFLYLRGPAAEAAEEAVATRVGVMMVGSGLASNSHSQ
jgi:hypothetical protein